MIRCTILFLLSAYSGISAAISENIMAISQDRYVIFLLMNLILLVVGMFEAVIHWLISYFIVSFLILKDKGTAGRNSVRGPLCYLG